MAQRKRTARRAEDRAQGKLVRDLEKLWETAPGGAPGRPIVVASPSEIEVRAASIPCPICRSALRVEEHVAVSIAGVRLRVARVVCTFCRVERVIHFQLASAAAN
jgi:hypothetical protein